jgi:hypothetical protein
MSEQISIVTATRDGQDGLIVTFSDGTLAGYVAEELLDLRPHRESIRGSAANVCLIDVMDPIPHSAAKLQAQCSQKD